MSLMLSHWRQILLSYPDREADWHKARRRAHYVSGSQDRRSAFRFARVASASPRGDLARRYREAGRALSSALAANNLNALAEALEALRAISSSLANRVFTKLTARRGDLCGAISHCECCSSFSVEPLHRVSGGDSVCDTCLEDDYCTCSDCSETVANDDVSDINGDSVCSSCRANGDYFHCHDCSEWFASDDGSYELSSGRCVCSGCSDSYYYWESDGLYHDDEEDDETISYPNQGKCERETAIHKWLTSRAALGIQDCELPNSGLSDQGFSALFEAMMSRGLIGWDYDVNSVPPQLCRDGKAVRAGVFEKWAREEGYCRGPDGIAWSTKAGTLPKRIAKFFASCGVKLKPDSLGMIGDLARSYCPKSHKYRYDVVTNGGFDWNSGDFGDHGSCYWGCHSKCRHQLRSQHNAFALRWYDVTASADNPRGVGRCWVVVQDGVAFLFNYYGPDSLLTAARMLATECKGLYHEVRLSCNSGTSDFYLNGSGNGYSVGYREDSDFPAEHDFNFRGF